MSTENNNQRSKIVEIFKGFFSGGKADFFGGEDRSNDIFEKYQKRQERREKMFKILGFMLVLVLIIAAGFAVYFRSKNLTKDNIAEQSVKVEIPENQDHVFVNDVSGVMPETPEIPEVKNEKDLDLNAGLVGVSENYRLKDVAIGGANVVLAGDDENLPLKVSDVRSETLMSKDGKEIKMLVSWKTNKLAKSKVQYSKNGGVEEKSFNEDGYGFSHALVMNKLDSSTRYLFTVNATDRSGNKDVSDQLAVFTGAKPVSVFEMIASQFGDIFGWAMKK